MKKYLAFLCLFSALFSFALTDTDADGVADEKDICPRVYSRSETGCPRLAAKTETIKLNSCLIQASKDTIILTLTPICTGTSCPELASVSGVQRCDPIFPVIFDDKGTVIIRGGIYIVGFTS